MIKLRVALVCLPLLSFPAMAQQPALTPVDPAVLRDAFTMLSQQINEKCGGMIGVAQRIQAAEAAAVKPPVTAPEGRPQANPPATLDAAPK